MSSSRVVHAVCSLDCPDTRSLHITVNSEGRDTEDDLINQALVSDSSWIGGIARERLESEHSIRPKFSQEENGGSLLPFNSAEWLELHPSEAAARGIVDGDEVEIFNERGKILLHAKVIASAPAGVAVCRLGWNKLASDGQGFNMLTAETLTDLGGGPTFYSTLVEVRLAEKSEAVSEAAAERK